MKKLLVVIACVCAATMIAQSAQNPRITSLNPNQGTVGATVQINGSGFKANKGQNAVTFNGTPAAVLAATSIRLSVTVPAGATSGPVRVKVGGKFSNGMDFTVIPPPPPPLPALSLSANPASILAGQSSVLSWSSTNADVCTASGAWSGAKPTNGSQSVSPAASSSYSLTCSNASGDASETASVSVTAPPPPPDPGTSPTISGIAIFPSDNVWNTPVDTLPAQRAIDILDDHGGHNFHADFGTTCCGGRFNGIPVNVVAGSSVAPVRVNITLYAGESDLLPGGDQTTGFLPLPPDVKIEGDPPTAAGYDPNGDNHLILIDSDTHTLHELYNAIRQPDGSITAKQYSRWDLNSNALRPDGITSTDAAGLPVVPGLVLYDQVAASLAADPTGGGNVGHALRFTLDLTHGPHLWPARHDANSGGTNNPPFGLRVRMKSDVDISAYSPTNRVILNTLKKYGALLTDNGGDWFFQGAPDPRWNDEDLHLLIQVVPYQHFEVVDTQNWIVSFGSGQANPGGSGPPPPPSAPTLNLTAAPSSILAGESSTLQWTSANTTGCTASGAWSGTKALSGSETVFPSESGTYSLTCVGDGGTVTKSATVAVGSSAGGLTILTLGAGIEQSVTIDSPGQFRLVFEAADNWGLSQWYDLVNDPSAATNLAGPGYGVAQGDLSLAEPGLFQQVYYGTTPDDPKLYTRAAKYYFPSAPRSFEILENSASRLVVRTTAKPIAGTNGVLDNVTVAVTYKIYPDGRIYVHSETSATNTQSVSSWLNSIMGLQNPGGTGSIPPDTFGWIRASTHQNPYEYWDAEPYIFAYWQGSAFTKANILLVPRTGNPSQGKQQIHSWTNWMRWGYGGESVTIPAGGKIVQDYLIQLGTEGSAVLPNIRNATVAGPLANAYQASPLP